MVESLDNIVMLCEEHSSKPLGISNSVSGEYFIGRYVKLSFPTMPEPDDLAEGLNWPPTEHMWVMVTGAPGGRELAGRLSNDPVFCELSRGDMVEFAMDGIEKVFDGEP